METNVQASLSLKSDSNNRIIITRAAFTRQSILFSIAGSPQSYLKNGVDSRDQFYSKVLKAKGSPSSCNMSNVGSAQPAGKRSAWT
ncbi:hypothetical protein R1flu_018168 [Riccia fluitans]|uniref:Uncharacterized protein n=1 Tax=Riccia fluitans TaxID=41844 RepID=A0ABD1ZF21_9MARC